jgi:hypothetical protein
MGEAVRAIGPMLAFMCIPIWIPLVTVAVGRLYDLVRAEDRER